MLRRIALNRRHIDRNGNQDDLHHKAEQQRPCGNLLFKRDPREHLYDMQMLLFAAPVVKLRKGAEIFLAVNGQGRRLGVKQLFRQSQPGEAFKGFARPKLSQKLQLAVLIADNDRDAVEGGVCGLQRLINIVASEIQILGVFDLRQQIHIDIVFRDFSKGQKARFGKLVYIGFFRFLHILRRRFLRRRVSYYRITGHHLAGCKAFLNHLTGDLRIEGPILPRQNHALPLQFRHKAVRKYPRPRIPVLCGKLLQKICHHVDIGFLIFIDRRIRCGSFRVSVRYDFHQGIHLQMKQLVFPRLAELCADEKK